MEKDSVVIRVPLEIADEIKELVQEFRSERKKLKKEEKKQALSRKELDCIRGGLYLVVELDNNVFKVITPDKPIKQYIRRALKYTHSLRGQKVFYNSVQLVLDVHVCGDEKYVRKDEITEGYENYLRMISKTEKFDCIRGALYSVMKGENDTFEIIESNKSISPLIDRVKKYTHTLYNQKVFLNDIQQIVDIHICGDEMYVKKNAFNRNKTTREKIDFSNILVAKANINAVPIVTICEETSMMVFSETFLRNNNYTKNNAKYVRLGFEPRTGFIAIDFLLNGKNNEECIPLQWLATEKDAKCQIQSLVILMKIPIDQIAGEYRDEKLQGPVEIQGFSDAGHLLGPIKTNFL